MNATGQAGPNHLILCIDVGLMLQQQHGGGDGRDICRQVESRVAVDVHQVGVGVIFQQYVDAALMLALHCLTMGEITPNSYLPHNAQLLCWTLSVCAAGITFIKADLF